MSEDTRANHVAWAKERALEFVDQGNLIDAMNSITSDLRKHPQTAGHAATELMTRLMFSGHLNTPAKMRNFIEGIN